MKTDEKKIADNQKVIEGIIEKFIDEPRKAQILKMLDGEVGVTFYTAPASTKEKFHSCYPGGLAAHTISVIARSLKLAESLCPSRWSKETVTIAALFHDFGKVGNGVNDLYIPTKEDWKIRRGEHYDFNEHIQYMTVPQRSLFLLQNHGIVLTEEEYLAVLLSDGQYVAENKSYAMREPDLALIIHFADMWVTKQEKNE